MKHVYTSIDIGSDSIKVVACELFKNKLNLLAASSVKSKGIKKGLITDPEAASASLRMAMDEIQQMLGVAIKKVIVSIPSYFADFTIVKGRLAFADENHIINSEDIVNVIENAIGSKIGPLNEMVTVLPIDFSLDGKTESVIDPKGMLGTTLSTRAIMITTPKKNVYSVVSLVSSLGIEVIDISINGIGDIYALKDSSFDEKVGALINIGAETTSVSIYNKGIIVKSSILPMGGYNIDSDIAYIYKMSIESARKLKEKFALAHKIYAQTNDIVDVIDNVGEVIKINQYEISDISMLRIREILENAKKEIMVLTNRQIDYIIVTGGVSNMTHFEYVVSDVFGKVATVGNINLIGIRNNKYSTAIGNVVYFISKLKLKGKDYSMFNQSDVEQLSLTRKSATMVGKVFSFFFNE